MAGGVACAAGTGVSARGNQTQASPKAITTTAAPAAAPKPKAGARPASDAGATDVGPAGAAGAMDVRLAAAGAMDARLAGAPGGTRPLRVATSVADECDELRSMSRRRRFRSVRRSDAC
jgi:hypothetical protein